MFVENDQVLGKYGEKRAQWPNNFWVRRLKRWKRPKRRGEVANHGSVGFASKKTPLRW